MNNINTVEEKILEGEYLENTDLSESERDEMITQLARRATSEMDLGDLVDYFESNQVDFYSSLNNKDLIDLYDKMEK